MADVKEKSIHHTAVKMCDEFQCESAYENYYKEVQKIASNSSVKFDNFTETLTQTMKEKGLENELRNNVFHWLQNQNMDGVNLTINSGVEVFFKKAHIQWEKRIHKSMNSMCSELGIHLAKTRFAADRDELIEKWEELSNYDVDINKYRPVYSPRDFLEVLLSLKGPNYKPRSCDPVWNFSHIPLKVKDIGKLRSLYSELSRGDAVMGINPSRYVSSSYAAFEAERSLLGEKVLYSKQAPAAQEYLKRGCPACLREKMWILVLGSEVRENHYVYFDKLKNHVLQYDLMIDKLIIKDIHLTASNDDQYFVFEDVLHQILLCFSRDSEILEKLPNRPGYMQVVLKGKPSTAENTVVFPPSGVIPFHGFTMYAAPFCYIFKDTVALYFTVRAFYLRYWFRLHRVCGHPQGILSLCLMYERLLQYFDPVLWHHFRKIHIPPVRVVFKWIMRAFSGHLQPEQLLYLWDLVLAYDSLEIIPLLAVVIVIFRRSNLLRVTTLQNIEAVLADLSSVMVMPMLQMALSKEH